MNVSALALMVVVTIQLTFATFGTPPQLDWVAVSISIGSAILGIRFQVNSTWLVLGGAAISQMAYSLR